MVKLPGHIEEIASRVSSGERISCEEALALWNDAPLWALGEMAVGIKRRKSGTDVYYNRNFHIEPTNICRFNCRFCSYRREEGSPGAWNHSPAEIAGILRERRNSGATEVHIVGGVHPRHDLEYYITVIKLAREIMPSAAVKAYTAIELAYIIEKEGIPIREGLQRLKNAGMAAMPGGGAEIFAHEVRSRICPEKGDAGTWLGVHETAHGLGIKSNATMLYGHIETPEHRIDHMERLRTLQDRTGGFDAFIPLKYRAANNPMSGTGEVSVTEDMRVMALSRIFLDNFPHIKAYWPMFGKATAEMALAFGADDVDGTIEDTTKIYSMAGAEDARPVLTVEEIGRMASAAGFTAVERDTFYNKVK